MMAGRDEPPKRKQQRPQKKMVDSQIRRSQNREIRSFCIATPVFVIYLIIPKIP